MRILPAAALLTCLGAAVALLVEGRRVAQVAGEQEILAREARAAAAAATARCAAELQQNAQLLQTIGRLERQLESALDNAHAVGQALTEQVEAAEQAAAERAAAAAAASAVVPSGVQSCLDLLRECLLDDGFPGVRFLRARALVEHELRDVELLDSDPRREVAEVIVAERMTATLDRATSSLQLTFFGGHRRALGVRAGLPESGFVKSFAGVTGPLWEQRLPSLLQTVGQYPVVAPPAAAVDPDRLDGRSRAAWSERIDSLLALAGTKLRLRVSGFSGLRDGRFRTARLLGYDAQHLLVLTADCAELAVEIDTRAAVVSLLLRDGVLRQHGGESSIGADGYRMLLPSVTPEQATHVMLGMVVQR